MNTLIYYGISLGLLSVLVLVVGMIKPKWIFIWMEKPGRLPVVTIAGAIFMIAAVLFGEGNKRLQLEKTQKSSVQSVQPVSEVPVPAAVAPAPIPGKQ